MTRDTTTYPGPDVEFIIETFVKTLDITDTAFPNIEVFYDYEHQIVEVEVEGVLYHSPMDDGYTFTKQTSHYPPVIVIPHKD